MKNIPSSVRALFLIFFIIFNFISQISATEFIFTGIGNYTDASFWSPSYPTGQIPAGDTAIISLGSTCTIPAGTFIFIQGVFINDGNLVSNNNFGAFSGGSIINNGYIHVFAVIDNLGNIFNNGTIEAESSFSSQGSNSIIDNALGATIINKASFIASSNDGASFNFEGIFKGTGAIHVDNYPNQGIIAPGFSPGVLTFKNNLALENSGTLEIEIAGLGGAGTINGHDQIIVQKIGGVGDLSIDGTLKVILLDGYTPEIGGNWTIAMGNTSGGFSILDLPTSIMWDVDIQTDRIVLEAIGVNLPVALIGFKAVQKEDFVQLDWSTSLEFQNDIWKINRLDNQGRWQNLGELSGNGNSQKVNNYQFKDFDPSAGLNYYRLTQIDFNGQKSYSPIVDINFRPDQIESLIFPNPSKGMLYFSVSINSAMVYNLQGQNVFISEANTQILDLGILNTGTYILNFKTGKEEHSKFICIE